MITLLTQDMRDYTKNYSTRNNHIGVSNCAETSSAPPWTAENEIEQFLRMEMIDMVITKKLDFRPKVEKCKQFLFRVLGKSDSASLVDLDYLCRR